MPNPTQNQKQKFWFMIFWPKITNTNRNPNTITNINTEITNTNFKSMIFPFKITNQTQISDLWFSFFPFKNHKHKHKLTPWRTRRTEPRKKKKKRNGERGGVRSCHACGHGRGRWKGQRTVQQARSTMARTKRSWESRELGIDDTVELRTAAKAWDGG